jgi:hypothetical protein
MRLGLQLNSFDWDGGSERFAKNLTEIARIADGGRVEGEPLDPGANSLARGTAVPGSTGTAFPIRSQHASSNGR